MKKILILAGVMTINLCFGLNQNIDVVSIAQILASHDEIPGIAVAAGSCEKIKTHYAGYTSLNSKNPVDKSSQFNLGSNGKSILTTTIAIMINKGLLTWDQPLPAYLSSFKLDKLTLKDMLLHKSGLPGLSTGKELNQLSFDESEVDQRIQFAKHALNFFDEKMYGKVLYSNAGYVISALMIEEVAGKPYQALIQEYLLRPLNLTATFSDPEGDNQNSGHHREGGEMKEYDSEDPAIPAYLSPAGNVSMNVEDYGKYLQVNLCGLLGKNNDIIPSGLIQALHTPEANETSAYGWGVDTIQGNKTSFHIGGTGTFSAVSAIVPNHNFFVTILINSGESNHAIEKVIDILGQLKNN